MFNSSIFNLFSLFNPTLLIIIGLIAIIVIALVVKRILNDRKKIEEFLEKEYVILSILVPKNNEKTPLAAEQMFASLHGILKPHEDKQEHMCFEIASRDKFTQFFVCTTKELKHFVEGQIYAQYPSVEIKEVPDYTDVDLDGMSALATELTLSKEDVYPIKTFLSFEVDPLAGITGVLSKVEGAERVWVQILTRPVDDDWQDRGVDIVKNTRDGIKPPMSFRKEIFNAFIALFKEIFIALISPPKPDEKKKEDKKDDKDKQKLPGPVETAMTGIETKIQKLGFATKIRIMTISEDEDEARAKLMAVVGAFRQFNTTNLNSFVMGKIVDGHELLPVFQMRPFGDGGNVFNIEELASIYHFPHMNVETPSIVWAGAKKGEPPANLPVQGIVDEDEMTILAQTNFRHNLQVFGIKKLDRRLHMYSIGKTGTGKSTLMENMIYDDIIHGRGLAVVDPHGQTIDHILKFIPEERMKDVVYLNPADIDNPIGFNLLENIDAEQKNIMASGLMSVFLKLWEGTFSARMEYILRNTILALLEYPKATMLGIMRVLNDKDYRKKVLSYVKDPVILDFFINEYEKYDPKFRTEAIAPIQNKVGQFLSSSTIRNIVGQQSSTISISEIMDSGKIFLVDLSIGKIGEDNSTLLGSMLITKIQLAAMQRAHIPEEQRRDFYLYVDEFQNFATESFAVILSEARKYHLNLVLTNQYTAQVPEVVMDAIMGNIGTMVAFRVGAPDADVLAKEFEPVFEANDLVNQPNRHVYIKMAIDGVTCPAFSADTLPPRLLDKSYGQEAIEFSSKAYGRSREQVEAEIQTYMTNDGIEPEIIQKPVDPVMAELRQEYKEVSIKGGYKWYLGAGEEEVLDDLDDGDFSSQAEESHDDSAIQVAESVASPSDDFASDESETNEPSKEDFDKLKIEENNKITTEKPHELSSDEKPAELNEKESIQQDNERLTEERPNLSQPEDHHIISSSLANKIAKKARKKKRNKDRPKEELQAQIDNNASLNSKTEAPEPVLAPASADKFSSLPDHHTTNILEEGETVDLRK